MARRPHPRPEVVELQSRAFAHGVTMTEVFNRAGIAASRWTVWRRGARPRGALFVKIVATLDALIAEEGLDS